MSVYRVRENVDEIEKDLGKGVSYSKIVNMIKKYDEQGASAYAKKLELLFFIREQTLWKNNPESTNMTWAEYLHIYHRMTRSFFDKEFIMFTKYVDLIDEFGYVDVQYVANRVGMAEVRPLFDIFRIRLGGFPDIKDRRLLLDSLIDEHIKKLRIKPDPSFYTGTPREKKERVSRKTLEDHIATLLNENKLLRERIDELLDARAKQDQKITELEAQMIGVKSDNDRLKKDRDDWKSRFLKLTDKLSMKTEIEME